MTGDVTLFKSIRYQANCPSVRFGDGVVQQAVGIGTIELCNEWLEAPITIDNVLYIPNCPVNLLSVNATARSQGCIISFDADRCIATRGSRTLWTVPATTSGVYHFESVHCPIRDSHPRASRVRPSPAAFSAETVTPGQGDPTVTCRDSAKLWHRRFGHPGQPAMHMLSHSGTVTGGPNFTRAALQKFSHDPCDACCLGKAIRKPYPNRTRNTHAPLELIHIDIMGPFSAGLRGELYLLVIVDDFSGWSAVIPIRLKSDAAWQIQFTIKKWSAELLGVAFRTLRGDQAKEFLVKWFVDWLHEVNATYEHSSVYCPQQNGVAERFNGVVAAMARTMLIESGMSKGFWPYAFLTASYLRNRLPTKTKDGKTPYELFYQRVPEVSHLRVFGCIAYVTLLDGKKRGKLDPKSIQGRLVGYSVVSKAYQVWIPKLHKVIEARDVTFFEGTGPVPVDGQLVYDGSSFASGSPLAVTEGRTEPAALEYLLQDSGQMETDVGAVFHMNLRSRQAAAPNVSPVFVPDTKTAEIIPTRCLPFSILPPSVLAVSDLRGEGGASGLDKIVETPFLVSGNPLFEPEVLQLPIARDEQLPSDLGNVDSSDTASDSTLASAMSMPAPGWIGLGDVGDAPDVRRPELPPGRVIQSLLSKVTPREPRPPPLPSALGVRSSGRMRGEVPEFGLLDESVLKRYPSVPDVTVPDVLVPSPSPSIAGDTSDEVERSPPSPSVDGSAEEVPEPVGAAFISIQCELSYAQAIALDNPEREEWQLAMRDEIASLEGHGTWILEPHPGDEYRLMSARWLFTKKLGKDGRVERYKARFVARGYMQRPGIEYDQTFAPVTSKATLRVLLAGVVHRKMFSRQIDVKTAFLHGVIDPNLKLYLRQPDGFIKVGPNGKPLVCRIVKSLYGLKQAPRAWHDNVLQVLRLAGFRPTLSDPALFVRLDADGLWSWVLTYVDDFWIAVDELVLYDALITILRNNGWVITEMGVPEQFLSLDCNVTLDDEGRCVKIVLSQHNAINGMVERFKLNAGEEKLKATSEVPMVSKSVTVHAIGSPVLPNNTLYASLVGSLIYLSTCTRPDIAFAVSQLSRFTAAPTQAHWNAALRVLVYLRKHTYIGIAYTHDPKFELLAYSDASFGEDPEDRRSQTGLAFLASGGIVNWVSKRQITPAVSTGEAEYQALAGCAREVQWLKHLRVDLGLPVHLITIKCDATVALSWTEDYKLESKAKHIDIMHHYIKDLVLSQRIGVTKVHTSLQLADTFTKPLPAEVFWSMNGMLGLVKYKLLPRFIDLQ